MKELILKDISQHGKIYRDLHYAQIGRIWDEILPRTMMHSGNQFDQDIRDKI